MTNPLKNLLGYVLHVANSSPPTLARDEFYDLKSELLRRYGKADGFDVQHIKRLCFRCDGTGIYDHYYGPRDCWHCERGVYRESWIKLERWSLGGYFFHIPTHRFEMWDKPNPLKGLENIEGLIRHDRIRPWPFGGHFPGECAYWLLLIFRPDVFRQVFGSCGHLGSFGGPLCQLGRLVFNFTLLRERIEGWHGEHTPFRATQTRLIDDMERHLRWKRERRVWGARSAAEHVSGPYDLDEDELPF